MFERTATVLNAQGIHCRPSAVIIQFAHTCPCDIQVKADSGQTNLRSLIELVSLGLEAGAVVTIRVAGPDEEAWCAKLADLFQYHFDFPALSAAERAALLEKEE